MNLGLLGALGGLGQGISAFGQAMLKDIDSRDAEKRQLALEEWRMRLREQYDLEREKRAEEAKRAEDRRYLDSLVASDELATQALREREFQRFKSDLGSTDAPEEELRSIFEQHYFDKSVAPGDKNSDRYNPKDSEFVRQQRMEAVKIGAPTGLISSLYTQEKDTINRERQAEQDAHKQWLDEERLRRQEAKDDWQREKDREVLRIQGMNAQANLARANGSGESGKKDDEKLTPRQKSELKILEEELKSASEAVGKAVGSTAKAQAQERLNAAELRYRQFWDRVDGEKPAEPANPPAQAKSALTELPKGAVQVGTSGGKPVYRLPDGRMVIKQ